jgi:hypothetical protein
MGKMRNAYKLVVRKPQGKRPLGRCRHRWEDNIGMKLKDGGGKVWSGCIWFRTGTSGRLLCTQK